MSKAMFYIDKDKKQSFNPEDCKCNEMPSRMWMEIIIPNTGTSVIPLQFNPTPFSTTPWLSGKPKNWVISPQRFTIPAQTIPLTNLGITGTSTEMGVCISYTGVNMTGAVIAIQEDNTTSVNGGYVNNYQTIADSVNNSLSRAHLAMNAITGYSSSFAPYLSYNPTTFEYSLNAPQVYDVNITGSPQVFMNWQLFEKFQNFQYLFNGRGNANYKDYQLKIKGNGNNTQVITSPSQFTATSATGYVMTQPYNSLYNWNIFKNITITSLNIPVVGYNINNLGNSIAYTQDVISDFEISTELGYDARNYIHYEPSGEFRRIDMKGSLPLDKFGFRAWWVDNNQNFNSLGLPPATSASLLWLIEDKDVWKDTHRCERGK